MLGRVYKIVDSQSDDVYVGSTFRELSVRFNEHCGGGSSTGISKLMKVHGKSRYSIILIREYKVIDKYQLHAYEQLWINKTKCINKQSAFRILSLYNIANKDEINAKRHEYYIVNREHINNQRKLYREANRDKIKEYQRNKNKKREYDSKYYETNKSKILERLNEKFNCECGGKYTFQHKSRHMKTKKHLDFESKK